MVITEKITIENNPIDCTFGAEIDTEVEADDSELASDSAGEPTPVVCLGFLFLGRPFNFGAEIF